MIKVIKLPKSNKTYKSKNPSRADDSRVIEVYEDDYQRVMIHCNNRYGKFSVTPEQFWEYFIDE
jgi:hypothetical protein